MRTALVILAMLAQALAFNVRQFRAGSTVISPAAPASTVTSYYVDPDYAGGTRTGSASQPWQSLTDTVSNTPWAVISGALATSDVTVYFSARDAGADTDDVYGLSSDIDLTNRTDTSAHRLTLDGRSKYNSDDSSPNWTAQLGTGRSALRSITSQNAAHVKYSYFTIDGFRIAQSGGAKGIAICGDHYVVQNNDISHTNTATDGPLVLVVPNADGSHEGSGSYCPVMTDIQIINNNIHDSFGEAVYVGGGGCSSSDATGAGASCQGFPSHTNITISGNSITNAGRWGGEGDAVDMKGGLSSVTVSGNTMALSSIYGRCVVMQGGRVADGSQNVVIEKNYCHDSQVKDAGIALSNSWGTAHGVEIRNNILDTLSTGEGSGDGILIYDGTAIGAYNNIVYNSQTYCISIAAGTVTLKNNACLNNNSSGAQANVLGGVTLTSTNNAYNGTWAPACTSCISGLNGSTAFTDAPNGDFTSKTGGALIDAGTTIASFSSDFLGIARPVGVAWDIGAYER